MSEGQIVFYDLRSKEPNSTWSVNPWKTRMLLNYKGLDYRTVWLNYPDIKPTFEPHVQPNGPDLIAPYTIPAITLPDGTWHMRSEVIAAKIEELYPSPSAHLDSPYWPKVSALVGQMDRLRPIYMHAACTNVLHEGSVDFFYRDRSEKVGMPLEKLLEARGGAEKLFDSFEEVMKDATALLKENGDGPYFEGKTVGYADFVWVTFLLFFRRLDQKFLDELLKRAGDADVHLKLLEATAQWYARDTY